MTSEDLQVTYSNRTITVTIPTCPAKISKTGKSRIVASTGGFLKTNVEIEGKLVSINLTAIIPA